MDLLFENYEETFLADWHLVLRALDPCISDSTELALFHVGKLMYLYLIISERAYS